VNISGSVQITNVPIYTLGDFCLSGSSQYTGSQLEVGGNLTVVGSASIGKSNQKISELDVVGTCTNHPTNQACDGSHGAIFAQKVSNTLSPSNLSMPPVNLAGTYAAQNTAYQSCNPAGCGCPAGFFDNDTTLNDSRATVTASTLFGSSYNCQVGSNDLKFTSSGGTSGTLVVNGTFIFDGSLALSGSGKVVYSGAGTIYFTGTEDFAGSQQLCGVAACNSTWQPSIQSPPNSNNWVANNQLDFVAGCWQNHPEANPSNPALVTYSGSGAYCLTVEGSSTVQAGMLATTDYVTTGSAQSYGPVIANTLTYAGSSPSTIPFHAVAPGAPVDTHSVTITQPAQAPTNWSG